MRTIKTTKFKFIFLCQLLIGSFALTNCASAPQNLESASAPSATITSTQGSTGIETSTPVAEVPLPASRNLPKQPK
ncbi:MAG: hypothetical protein HC899_39995 [Leptolyngbyaceae cyanobacterium SM1_4_3]|nr:hypothetical protein [Leptolyngbyaceae cyanobacterium SM1_4_3]